MCRGHPKHHRCAHSSVSWYYCPSAYLDMATGAVSPCGNPIMNDSQPTKAACPLAHCRFAAKGANWTCCQCRQGPNVLGWCTQRLAGGVGVDPRELQRTCDHGCCENCASIDEDKTWRCDSDSASSRAASESDGTGTWVSSPPSSKASSETGSERGGRDGVEGKKREGKKSAKRR